MKYKLLSLIFCCLSLCSSAHSHKAKMKTGFASKSVFAVVPQAADYTYISSRDGHVMIYPNPASDRLYVKGDGQTAYNIELLNMLGAVVLSEEVSNGVVSLSGLQPGLYLLRVYGTDGQIYLSSKLVKQ